MADPTRSVSRATSQMLCHPYRAAYTFAYVEEFSLDGRRHAAHYTLCVECDLLGITPALDE